VNLLAKLSIVLRISCLCLGQHRRYLFLSVGKTTSSSDDVVDPGIVVDRGEADSVRYRYSLRSGPRVWVVDPNTS
jgi:hypothetical protein